MKPRQIAARSMAGQVIYGSSPSSLAFFRAQVCSDNMMFLLQGLFEPALPSRRKIWPLEM